MKGDLVRLPFCEQFSEHERKPEWENGSVGDKETQA